MYTIKTRKGNEVSTHNTIQAARAELVRLNDISMRPGYYIQHPAPVTRSNTMDTYGTIHLDGGRLFRFMRMNDGEICGYVERADGTIVKGSYGFWRTNNENEAARIASKIFPASNQPTT